MRSLVPSLINRLHDVPLRCDYHGEEVTKKERERKRKTTRSFSKTGALLVLTPVLEKLTELVEVFLKQAHFSINPCFRKTY